MPGTTCQTLTGKTTWVGSFLARVPAFPNPRKSFMIDSYWELYVSYIRKCVHENRVNGIDPHHYEMEWNHFLPRCIFGDQPLGQYLLLKQHAMATALQTLAFKRNCLCGWHKKYLPDKLIELAWPYYVSHKAELLGWNPTGYQWCNNGFTEKYSDSGLHLEDGWVLGRLPVKESTREKCNTAEGRVWVTNGDRSQEIFLREGEDTPKGWSKGRKKRPPRSQEVRDRIRLSKTGKSMSEEAKLNMKKAALEREKKKRQGKTTQFNG